MLMHLTKNRRKFLAGNNALNNSIAATFVSVIEIEIKLVKLMISGVYLDFHEKGRHFHTFSRLA